VAPQGQRTALQLLQQPPADILHCMSCLLAASEDHTSHLPYLASRGSSTVLASCQLLQAYQVLADGAQQCAAAMLDAAATVAARGGGSVDAGGSGETAMQEQPALIAGWVQSVAARGNSSSGSSAQQASLAGELSLVLLRCSQRLLLLLVSQGWDVLALDQLPLGVALPLKEALALCRSNPPPGEELGRVVR
jgi:hypothetical protein